MSPEIGRPPNAGWGALARTWMVSTSGRLSRPQATPECGDFDDSQPTHPPPAVLAAVPAPDPRVPAHHPEAGRAVGGHLAVHPVPGRPWRPTTLPEQLVLHVLHP